jgi:hypothetical protein
MKKFYVTINVMQPVAETWAFTVPDDTDIKEFKRVFKRDPNFGFLAYPQFEFHSDDAGDGEFSHLGDVSDTPPNT